MTVIYNIYEKRYITESNKYKSTKLCALYQLNRDKLSVTHFFVIICFQCFLCAIKQVHAVSIYVYSVKTLRSPLSAEFYT